MFKLYCDVIYIMKWKYSVQYENEEGSWQEEDSFIEATEALKCKEKLMTTGKKMPRVVDLESGQEIS